jgi:leucyl aminopeptidase
VKTVSGLRELAKAGFPGLCQVGVAGSAEPALVEIAYKPKKAKGKAKLALVGKGLTFDSGGISLKPGDKMWEMKADMGGAAAVYAAMKAIAILAPAVPVTAYLALAENMPDSKAQRPGDIYVTRKGISIHVDNTDAEGRLVLADVLTYACEQGATHLVDVATLTGACLVALGDKVAGLFSRHDDWATQVRAAGQAVGEELWRLPLHGEYRSLMDHPHADINNIGGRNGGAITAALFLSEFVDPAVKWAHLDVAGPVIQTGGWRCYAKGMTGFATRSLVRLAEDLAR